MTVFFHAFPFDLLIFDGLSTLSFKIFGHSINGFQDTDRGPFRTKLFSNHFYASIGFNCYMICNFLVVTIFNPILNYV